MLDKILILEIRAKVTNLEKSLMNKIREPQVEPPEPVEENPAATPAHVRKRERKQREAKVDLQCMLSLPLDRRFFWCRYRKS